MIYVLGSINADVSVTVKRMPKKGETISGESLLINQGGKGANQAVAIAKLGEQVKFIGRIGSDAYADMLYGSIKSYGVDVTHLKNTNGDSGVAIIVVENGDNRIILHRGANYEITTADVDKALLGAKSGDVFLTQLEIPLNIICYALKLAKSKGMITVLNPAPAVPLNEDVLSCVDIITPNETETQILTGINPTDEAHIALAVKQFYSYGIKNVIITLGSRGSAVSFGQEITLIPAKKVKVVDTTSAGDTFIGAVVSQMHQGKDIVSACDFATCASAITVSRKGASISIPTISEVNEKYFS